jgi:predicted glycosyltransferase
MPTVSSSEAYNILMYSHDTYGLGHIRRTMAIAGHLRGPSTNVLILTGSPIAGRFRFPDQVDFVRIPGMIKKTNDEYHSLSIRIDPDKALAIRTNIILATTQAFQPHLVIVDKEPLGLKKEMLPTLEWLKNERPETMMVLGLRDILDDPEVVCQDWREKNIYSHLEELYDEIWVYGNQAIYDPVALYQIPASIHPRVRFTGYIPRKQFSEETRRKLRKRLRKRHRIADDEKFILVTTGGGGDGAEVIEHVLRMFETYPDALPFRALIVTGPFMPQPVRDRLKKRAKRFAIETLPFHPRLEELMAAADLVISMGGYNTICEILTQHSPALIIPRETPRREQLIRAKRLHREGLLDYIPWNEVTPALLRERIFARLKDGELFRQTMEKFPLSGLETMVKRLADFKNTNGPRHHLD